jgi:hypothetical protein
MSMTRWPTPPVPGDFGFPIGVVAGVVVTIAVVTNGGAHHPLWSVIALAVTVAAVCAVTTPGAGLATAVVCWLLHASFVVGRHGQVSVTAATGQAAVVLVATAVTVVAATAALRVLRAWLRTTTPDRRAVHGWRPSWSRVSPR